MFKNVAALKKNVYSPCGLTFSNYSTETESKDYLACRFELNGIKILFRQAKITPKKIGQFATVWKRSPDGHIEPFVDTDDIDYCIIHVVHNQKAGQFIFPKKLCIQKGLFSSNKKEGKRAIRVYPPWDEPKSKLAIKTQNWQKNYFIEITKEFSKETLKNRLSLACLL